MVSAFVVDELFPNVWDSVALPIGGETHTLRSVSVGHVKAGNQVWLSATVGWIGVKGSAPTWSILRNDTVIFRTRSAGSGHADTLALTTVDARPAVGTNHYHLVVHGNSGDGDSTVRGPLTLAAVLITSPGS